MEGGFRIKSRREGFRFVGRFLGIPLHHLLLHLLQHRLAAIRVAQGTAIEIRHGLHIQLAALKLTEGEIKGGLGLAEIQVVDAIARLLRQGWR